MQQKVDKSFQSGLVLVSNALMLAADGHAHQRRKSDNSPYINHLVEVMSLLITVAKVTEPNILCAAILHDSLEDTDITSETILNNIGKETLDIVEALTDNKRLSLDERRTYILKKLPNSADSIRLIKLADICSNASAIPSNWTESRLIEYFLWLDQVAEKCRISSEALFQEYLRRRNNSKS